MSEIRADHEDRRPLTAGVDVGGTKTHVALSTGEERIVSSAGWHRDGLDRVARGVAELLHETTSRPLAALAVGSHGCNDRVLCARLGQGLRDRLGELPILVVNDAELLLPSVRAPAGVGLIAGTGSVVVGYLHDGEMAIAGGWGGYIGDEGSSTGMFRDAARAVAEAYDRGDPDDPLVAILCGALQIDHVRELPAALDAFRSPTAWAHLTPSVFAQSLERGSELIVEVIEQQAAALASLIASVRGRGAAVDTVVAAGGVVVNADWFEHALRRALAAVSPESALIVRREPPVRGALNLAADLAILSQGGEPDGQIGPVLTHLFSARIPAADSAARSSNGTTASPVHTSQSHKGTNRP